MPSIDINLNSLKQKIINFLTKYSIIIKSKNLSYCTFSSMNKIFCYIEKKYRSLYDLTEHNRISG